MKLKNNATEYHENNNTTAYYENNITEYYENNIIEYSENKTTEFYENETTKYHERNETETFETISTITNLANFFVFIWILLALINFYKHQRRKETTSKKDLSLLKYSCFAPLFPILRTITTQSILFLKWGITTKANDQGC